MSDERISEVPKIAVEVVRDRTAESRCEEGFLRLRRLELRNRYEDGTESPTYRYDIVERTALDAVAIVLEAHDGSASRICLRSSLRPPLAFRPEYDLPIPDAGPPVLWEVPAGLIEEDERGLEGLRACAARETIEEVGLEVPPDAFTLLGGAACLSPGVLAEKIYFLHAVVDPAKRSVPVEDGSPVEAHAVVRFVSLEEAEAAIADGRIADLKTEVAIRRLIALRSAR